MTLPVFDGDAIDLRVNTNNYHSGGIVAAMDGSLLTWSLNVGVNNHTYIYASSQTRDIDTVAHDLGAATALNLNIRSKPTYIVDIDQLAGGNVIVSWVEPGGPNPSHSYYRIYDSAGHAVTAKTEFLSHDITALDTGGFCATFGIYKNGSSESFVQVFAADGTAVAPPSRINPTLAGDQNALGTTDLGGGNILTLYSDRQTSGVQTMNGRVFSAAGVAQTSAFAITTVPTDHYLTDIHSIALAGGDIVMTWTDNSPFQDTPVTVHARSFHANGQPAGAEFNVATASGLGGQQFGLDDSALVALDDGRWMVAWTDQRFDPLTFERSSQLFARIYNADGTIDQDTFDLALRPDYIASVDLQVLADGRVAVRYDTGFINQTAASFVQIIDPRLGPVTLTGSAFGDQFQGTSFADVIDGGTGKDKLAGMAGDDLLRGGAKDDSLTGETGNDTLNGGVGNDRLTGGLGRDSFVFGTGAGSDRVTDFNVAQDRLDLHAFHFATAAEALSHLSQGAEGAMFSLGADLFLLVGVEVTTLDAGTLTL